MHGVEFLAKRLRRRIVKEDYLIPICILEFRIFNMKHLLYCSSPLKNLFNLVRIFKKKRFMGGSIWKFPILRVWVMCCFSYSHAQEKVLVSGRVFQESVEIKSEILGETENDNINMPSVYHTDTIK